MADCGGTDKDTVIFLKKPFKIKVYGRTNQFMNTFGEELMIYHVRHAVNIAAKKLKAKIGEFTLSPMIQPNGKEQSDTTYGYLNSSKVHWIFQNSSRLLIVN